MIFGWLLKTEQTANNCYIPNDKISLIFRFALYGHCLQNS